MLISSLKSVRSLKLCHIRHRGCIPVTDVAVGGGGIGLIREPQVYRSLKIRIVKRGISDITRPIGCPILVTLKRIMDRRFVRIGQEANLKISISEIIFQSLRF